MSDDDILDLIKITAIRNALDHGGNAKPKVVLGKIISKHPEVKGDVERYLKLIDETIRQLHSLSTNEKRSLLDKLEEKHIGIFGVNENKKKIDNVVLPPLEQAEDGKVITRFPPEPNGYLHIGHAKAVVIDSEYARMYHGKLILRFDDTNPLNEKLEYYDAIIKGLDWLGIFPDIIKNTSDDIEKLYDFAKRLILLDGAYICKCDQQSIKQMRLQGIPCNCRSSLPSHSIDEFDKMLNGNFEPNEAILRFKGDMASLNTVMRDPTLFRIIVGNHPLVGDKYLVWPTYDFAAPIEDSLDGVTHAFRTKEYELRNELYYEILSILELRKPNMIEFSRLDFREFPVSKRKIKPLIDKNIIKNWDDPRLPTIMGLRRRGFLPDSIKKFVLSLGLTLSETKPPFESLESINRKSLDPTSIRLYFVASPVLLQIENIKPKEITINNHPNANLGERTILSSDKVYISGNDALNLHKHDIIRLMEFCNIEITSETNNMNNTITAKFIGNDVSHDIKKIQWVAKENICDYTILIPKDLYIGDKYNPDSLEIVHGYAESFVSTLKPNDSIQFVRFGFCRIDSIDTAIYTHR